jgi:large repetitive protein
LLIDLITIYTSLFWGTPMRIKKPSFSAILGIQFLFLLAAQLISTAQTPVFSVNHPGPVDFSGSPVGGSGSIPGGQERSFALSNTGTGVLTITNIQFTGAFFIPVSSPLLPPFNIQPGSAGPGFTVDFVPTVAGPQTGSITFTDNAPGSPHTIQFTGTGLAGAEFTLGSEFGPPSATVPAGQSANYRLELATGPLFSGTIAMGVQGAPPGTSLIVFPADRGDTFGVSPRTVGPLDVQITTRAVAVASNRVPGLWFGAAMACGLLLISGRKKTAGIALLSCLTILALSSFTACGGSHAADQKTPPGTYNVTFTATSGSVTQSVPATLIVQ